MMIMFNKLRLAAIFASVSIVAACAGPNAQREANGELPSPQEVVQIAKTAYQNTFGRAPQNLQINELKYAEVFFSEQDLVACVATTEREQGNVYNNAGEVIINAGTAYTKNHIMLMRRYANGWGSGIFRSASGGKIGSANIQEICPGR